MRIKSLRERQGLSQGELAARMGVDKAAVCRWESGKASPRTERLPELARILDCTIDDLYGRGPSGQNSA